MLTSLVGVIAGASVGGVFVVLLVVGSLYVYCRRQSKIEPVTELEVCYLKEDRALHYQLYDCSPSDVVSCIGLIGW